MNKSACELLSFIRQSPSPFHAVCRMGQELAAGGYEKLYEDGIYPTEKEIELIERNY